MLSMISTRSGWAAKLSDVITTPGAASIDKDPIVNMLFILIIASL
jgi:hypothetical protein